MYKIFTGVVVIKLHQTAKVAFSNTLPREF
jgi:hypothetical protein